MFESPWWLLLLLVVALLAAGYVWSERRRRRRTMRFTNLGLLERIAPRSPGWRRHVPVALVLVALAVMSIGLAGPLATEQVPRNRATVMLTIDVSLSMRATDVTPSRIEVAKRAAGTFVDQLPAGVNVGLVSFAGSASVLVSPTTNRESVKNAVGTLQLAESTGTGEAVNAALNAITQFGQQVPGGDGPPPARIVLLSDGKQTTPTPDPASPRGAYSAAERAKQAGVPISTISFGTDYGEIDIDGRPIPVPVGDDQMQEVASLSGGQFSKAASEPDLRGVYNTLAEQIGYEEQEVNTAWRWFVSATVLVALGLVTALALGQRLP